MTNVLLDRSLDIDDNTMLFHYCSAATFQAICATKTVRFSDINMMNDYSETQYSYRIFELAASDLLNTDLPEIGRIDREFFDKVDEVISPSSFLCIQ